MRRINRPAKKVKKVNKFIDFQLGLMLTGKISSYDLTLKAFIFHLMFLN